MLKSLIGILIIFPLLLGTAYANYYKWEDEQGTIHITDYPPTTESVKDSKVHKYESETYNNSTSTNKNEQKSSKSTKPFGKAQPTDSSSAQQIDNQEKNPAPYNCIKLCIQDSRIARKACRENLDDRRSCMRRNKEQLDNCRMQCHEEESSASSGYNTPKNNAGFSNRQKKSNDTSTALLSAAKFELVDKRDPAEREGYPYPKSWFSYVMHGDRSLNVDRLSILQTKLIKRFGSKLEGKIILLTQFYVMEKTVRPSFVKTLSGKQIANNGPFLPTLISEITISLEGDYFHGSAMLQLKQGSKSTHSALTIATTTAVDDLIKDMERSLKPH